MKNLKHHLKVTRNDNSTHIILFGTQTSFSRTLQCALNEMMGNSSMGSAPYNRLNLSIDQIIMNAIATE